MPPIQSDKAFKSHRNNLSNDKSSLKNTLYHIINALPGHVYWQDKNGTILGCNIRQANSLGYKTPDEVIGKHPKELLPKNEAKELMDTLHKVVNEKCTIKLEERLTFKQGIVDLLTEKTPLLNENNEVIGLLGISLDITEQKRMANELSEIRHKLEGMTLVAASIAHELRTPLTSIETGVENLRNYLPTLLEGYEMAANANLINRKLKPSTIEIIKNTLDYMKREIELSALVINLLLNNVNPNVDNVSNQYFSIVRCIEHALNRYPFKEGQRRLINWQPVIDFQVQGAEALVIHVLFNFIKNALHYIAEAGKGNISIWLESGDVYNTLIFKDTGKGIPNDVLPHIFKQFFSKTYYGAGIGLTYCKTAMEKLGGQIACESVYGDYTLFKLNFPRVASKA